MLSFYFFCFFICVIDEDDDDEYMSLLIIDPSKQNSRRNYSEEPSERTVASFRDDDVFAPGTHITPEELMNLPDVYQSSDDISMWRYVNKKKN